MSGQDTLSDLFAFLGGDFGDRFDFERYIEHEQSILRPELERRGFGKIRFSDGERDSFGPLSRIVTAVDQRGRTRRWCYG